MNSFLSRSLYKILLAGVLLILSNCTDNYETDCDPAYKAEIEKRVPEMQKRGDHRCTSADLCRAVEKGDTELVELYFKAGMNPNTKKFISNSRGRRETLLMIAAKNGDMDMMKLIIHYGGKISETERKGSSRSIHWAAMHGHKDIVLWLETLGENLNGDPEVLPITAANGHLQMAKYLLKAGIPVNSETEDYGRTALETAAENNHFPIVKCLIEAGANPDHHYGDALRIASRKENNDIIKFLVDMGADINLNNPKNALYSETALITAADVDNIDIVAFLIKNGAELEVKDHQGMTALHHAADGSYDITEQLLKAGADINSKEGDSGQTALMFAVTGQKKRNVELLLNNGADPSIKDKKGKTALDLAKEIGNSEITALIEKH